MREYVHDRKVALGLVCRFAPLSVPTQRSHRACRCIGYQGQYTILEIRSFRGPEPPIHYQKNEDELSIVIEGEMRLYGGGSERVLMTPSLRSMAF